MKINMRVIDAPVKFKESFDNQELYEMYLDENWHKVLIHNIFVLTAQIETLQKLLIGIENKRINDQLVRDIGGAGKIKVIS